MRNIHLLFALLLVLSWHGVSSAGEGAALPKESPPPSAPPPRIEVSLDTSEAPDMAEWAAKAKEASEKSYGLLLEHLGSEGFQPPREARIVFKDMKGVAYTSGGTIVCASAWFKAHPDDVGAVIHELCHVVQAYRSRRIPGWVTEGIADYVRWFCWEPAGRRPRVRNLQKARYTDSYQTTAAFFDWVVRKKDRNFIRRLNAACREGKYRPELFQEYAGKTADDLWAEFIDSLRTRRY